jgi:hypothetical protein
MLVFDGILFEYSNERSIVMYYGKTYGLCVISAVLLGLVTGIASEASDGGLALTPPMGWNSWNKFVCNVSETLIEETADAMVGSGMKDVGYEYVVIDDCWQVRRDADGNIVPDPERFPSGKKDLGAIKDRLEVTVAPHDVVMVRMTP